tara:strand:+ start:1650 stop:2585 length:936 start_codon:yes stop_codon:yes gene_type:complete
VNTRTYILSSSTLSAGADGYDIYESGATNLVISFSGVMNQATDATKYLKFMVEYPDDESIYTVQSLSDLNLIKNETISRYFYPTDAFSTTYQIDVSGLKSDFTVDLYRVNLNVGKTAINSHKDFQIINTHLFSNSEATNQLMVTVESQAQRYISNILIPYNKSRKVYLPSAPPKMFLTDNIYLRTEPLTFISVLYPTVGLAPVVAERGNGNANIVEETQYIQVGLAMEFIEESDSQHHNHNGLWRLNENGYPKTVFGAPVDINGVSPYSGNTTEDYIIIVPEDGIDYQYDTIDDTNPNAAYTGIYPAGYES